MNRPPSPLTMLLSRHTRRREVIAGLSAAAVLSGAALAQQAGRVARVGVLLLRDQDDPMDRERLLALRQALQALGWSESRNLRLEVHGAAENVERMGTLAKEFVDLQPDAIVVTGLPTTRALQQQTQTLPIIFVQAGDAVANGLVQNIARPEGNTTGISNNLPSFGGKWLDLLKEAVSDIRRVALVFNPALISGAYFRSIEAAAAGRGVTTIQVPVGSTAELERAIEALAGEPGVGLVEVPPPLVSDRPQLMYRLALKHRLPAIYGQRANAAEGGLMSYGPNTAELWRLAASYVDRILRGTKPGELPVQFPTRFELIVNLKTAKAMGLAIPESFLLRADEVIE